ncbi:hypothetical protein NEUTE1DRAFT_139454 [Neurospora tetrasperma FGSC 2508]|uniref:Uncharacterized protein n=1 Tax=Neurospora tetrasperma (strain FGSC 2508 / ATCC MYA-4615 / P0657) TaxID=510951 RepID=F8MT51_NEUT8|nr:uncharacterized protein NEUTE1DRAFT_139454 [Neurospora tetrasperma FGSC 2508]EGO55183.1 hypothetical protein NEUTE1DRAFT_139454 [Neurospora tetrasperma FGSC 2508]EGZ69601.1 hypothetical protein NEUTE2DRAFT_131998 [Neurospora tetrasperma FGSC 2509]
MSSFKSSVDVITLIERSDDHSIPDMHPMKRFGYAVGVLGFAALKGNYTVNGFKDMICHYVATLKRGLADADTNELVKKLQYREQLCGDILCALLHLEQKRDATSKDINLNEVVITDNNDSVHNAVEIVVDNASAVDESNSDHEFEFINESDADVSQADSSEWDLVSEMSDYL